MPRPTAPVHFDRALVGMESVQEILETAFFTATLANTVPLSILLVGPPGTGKSKSILGYRAPSLHITNDVTSSGLAELMERDQQNEIRQIMIPDFNIVVSHKSSTAALTVSSLLTLMSEGIMRIDDGRRQKEIVHAPIGVISAMTRDIYEDNAKTFRKLGIGRRFVPIFFTYGTATREKVQMSIKRGETTLCQLQPKPIILPKQEKWPIKVDMPQAISERLVIMSRDMADNLAMHPQWAKSYDDGKGSNETWKIVPTRGATPIEFTPHVVLRVMAGAHAVRAGRRVVKDADIDFIIRFIAFTNYAIPVAL